jgi:hypothetical protein
MTLWQVRSYVTSYIFVAMRLLACARRQVEYTTQYMSGRRTNRTIQIQAHRKQNIFFLRMKARVFLLMHGIETENARQPSFGNDL